FKVCRIEPENNVHLILEAFKEYPALNLIIVGNWENSDYARTLRNKYGNLENIFLLDPIYDQNKLNQIRSNCYVYVHGHSAGGTNPSLVEAMYLGLAIIAYGVNYNRETTLNKALYFHNVDSLKTHLSNLSILEIEKIGLEMEDIAKQNYTWKIVSNDYAKLF